jgi:tetraacyldisaccharide 4'-kinase
MPPVFFSLTSYVRWLLLPLSWLYRAIVAVRNFMYDQQWLRSFQFDFPVILVGNLSTGGTGKTPHVLRIAQLLGKHYRVAVLSRGYKRKTRGYIVATMKSTVADIGDEPVLLKQRVPGLEVAVSENRLEGISQLLLEEPAPEIIIMDDGFQHRRVKAGYNIILTSYSKTFVHDTLLPAGRLREPISSLRRADMIIVSKCPPDMTRREASEMRTALKLLPLHQLFFTSYVYAPLQPLLPEQPGQDVPSVRNCLVISGLASNDYLTDYLKTQYALVDTIAFRDHHDYRPADLQRIKTALQPETVLITTEKDAVKLQALAADILKLELSFFVLPVDVRFLFDGEAKFEEHIHRYVRDARYII